MIPEQRIAKPPLLYDIGWTCLLIGVVLLNALGMVFLLNPDWDASAPALGGYWLAAWINILIGAAFGVPIWLIVRAQNKGAPVSFKGFLLLGSVVWIAIGAAGRSYVKAENNKAITAAKAHALASTSLSDVRMDGFAKTAHGVHARIKNNGTGVLTYVTIKVRLLDANQNPLDTREASFHQLGISGGDVKQATAKFYESMTLPENFKWTYEIIDAEIYHD